MCRHHVRLWQNLAINADLSSEERDGQLLQARRECQAGQTCDGGHPSYSDPTADTAIANVTRTNRTRPTFRTPFQLI